jgi:hypothetical protein
MSVCSVSEMSGQFWTKSDKNKCFYNRIGSLFQSLNISLTQTNAVTECWLVLGESRQGTRLMPFYLKKYNRITS